MLDQPQREYEDFTRKSRHSISHFNEEDLQELKYLSELTLWQKVNILIYNCLESCIISFMMFNALIYSNLSSVLNIMIIAFICLAFVPKKHCNIKLRRNAIFANAMLSLIVIIAKILFIVIGKVKYQ